MNCSKVFNGDKQISVDFLWDEYARVKQTYIQLAVKYGCSKRTIQRKLDLYQVKHPEMVPKKVIVLMDINYWGRSFGLMLFKDTCSKENLLLYYINTETALYIKGINELKSKGFEIVAIVCDGREGLVGAFDDIPVQPCQFHQVAVIRRYITKNPKIQASFDLNIHVAMLKNTDNESFEGGLIKWESFLNERTINIETGKSHFTHKRLRSAYRSLNTNMKWLFMWYDNYGLNIPNTTDMIYGYFSDLKNKLRNHNELTKERKIKFINEFLKRK